MFLIGDDFLMGGPTAHVRFHCTYYMNIVVSYTLMSISLVACFRISAVCGDEQREGSKDTWEKWLGINVKNNAKPEIIAVNSSFCPLIHPLPQET